MLSIVNITFVSFSPYLRFFLNGVFNLVWKSPHLRRWKKAPQTPVKSNKLKSNRKPTPKQKSSYKCEAEEIHHKVKKAFQKEGCKTKIIGTKAREKIRRLRSQNWDLLGALLHKSFTFQIIFALHVLLQRILYENSKHRVDRKNLKYGENETNAVFTIDSTNVLKKNVHNLQNLKKWISFFSS